MSELNITTDGTLMIKASQEDYLKKLLLGLVFNTPKHTFTIVSVGYFSELGAFIQIRHEDDTLTVAHLYIDEDVFSAKNLKQSDLKITFDEDKHLTCRLKGIGDRILHSV